MTEFTNYVSALEHEIECMKVLVSACHDEVSTKEQQIKELREHGKWIRNRMVEVHSENPNFDYMIKFDKLLNK